MKNKIEYDPFVERQFNDKFSGTKVKLNDKDGLLSMANSMLNDIHLVDSNWDFCKYLILPNIFDIKCAVRELTLDVYPYIRTDYSSRTPDELPVLTRFLQLPPGFKQDIAKYIVLVLYSRDQLENEFYSKNDKSVEFYFDNDVKYGIVSIMGTHEPKPDPLVPITIMRNSLGKEEGGNGEKLDHKIYEESVKFWSKYILVK